MLKILLKKYISIAAAFSMVLSLSCCGTGDEVLIDEIDTETVSVEAETTTSETTIEVTTEKTTSEELTTSETITDEVTETTPEETSLTIPDEETILASLSDEEKEVWLSMPDIVTMRVLERFDENNHFLYNEIVYIDKICRVKKFTAYDDYTSPDEDVIIEWLNTQISQNEDAEIVDIADIHTLIEFYRTFMLVDRNTKFSALYTVQPDVYVERHYQFIIYGIRDNGENSFETLRISSGNAGNLIIRHNYTDDWHSIDTYGRDTLDAYLLLDPFVVPGTGYSGHLTGEEV